MKQLIKNERMRGACVPEPAQPSAVSSGSTAIYFVTMEWESGKRESISVDAKNKDDAMAKAFRKAFGLTNILVQCQR